MQYKMKRTTPEIVAAATTDGVSSEPTGTRSASRPPESRAGRADVAAADPRDIQLDVLASCAEVLLTSGAGKLEDAFAVLAPPLELDAYACFVASEGDHSFVFESARGLSDDGALEQRDRSHRHRAHSWPGSARSSSSRYGGAPTLVRLRYAISISPAPSSAHSSSTITSSAPWCSRPARRRVSPLARSR